MDGVDSTSMAYEKSLVVTSEEIGQKPDNVESSTDSNQPTLSYTETGARQDADSSNNLPGQKDAIATSNSSFELPVAKDEPERRFSTGDTYSEPKLVGETTREGEGQCHQISEASAFPSDHVNTTADEQCWNHARGTVGSHSLEPTSEVNSAARELSYKSPIKTEGSSTADVQVSDSKDYNDTPDCSNIVSVDTISGKEMGANTRVYSSASNVSSAVKSSESTGQDNAISSSLVEGIRADSSGSQRYTNNGSTIISSSTQNAIESASSDVTDPADGGIKTQGSDDGKNTGTTDQVAKQVKGLALDDVEEGELDYEEEGEIADDEAEPTSVSCGNDAGSVPKGTNSKAKEYDSGSEEGEIVSDGETQEGQLGDEEEGEIKDEDDKEEGEIDELPERGHRPRTLCRYFNAGTCRWGITCRFLHPGVNDKGNYLMLRPPGMYPTAFGKPPPPSECLVTPSHAHLPTSPGKLPGPQGLPAPAVAAATVPGLGAAPLPAVREPEVQTASPFDFEPIPQVEVEPLESRLPPPSPRKESAWERGLKRAKEIKQAAVKRREQDENFEEKRTKGFAERKLKITPEKRRSEDLRPKQPPGAYDERRFRRTPPFPYRAERDFRSDNRGESRGEARFESRGEGRGDRVDRDRFQHRGQRRTPSPPGRKYKGRDERPDVRRERYHDTAPTFPRPVEAPIKPPTQAPATPTSPKRRDPRGSPRSREAVDAVRPKPVKDSTIPDMPEAPVQKDSHPMARMIAAEQWRDPWMRTQPPQPKAKSPELLPLERSGSHSSISSSDSSDTAESDSESGSDDSESPSGSESDSDSSLSSIEPSLVRIDMSTSPFPHSQDDAAKSALMTKDPNAPQDPNYRVNSSQRYESRPGGAPGTSVPKPGRSYDSPKLEEHLDRGGGRDKDRQSRRNGRERGHPDDRSRHSRRDPGRDHSKPPADVTDKQRTMGQGDNTRQEPATNWPNTQAAKDAWQKAAYHQLMAESYMTAVQQAKISETFSRTTTAPTTRGSPPQGSRNPERRSPTSGRPITSRNSPKTRSPRRLSPRRGVRSISPARDSPKRTGSPRHPSQRRTSPRTASPSQNRKLLQSKDERGAVPDRSRISEMPRHMDVKRPQQNQVPTKPRRDANVEDDGDEDEDSASSFGSPVGPQARGAEPISDSDSESDSGSESESGSGSDTESEHSNSESEDSDSESESEEDEEKRSVPGGSFAKAPRKQLSDKLAQLKTTEKALRDLKSRQLGSGAEAAGRALPGVKRSAPEPGSSASTSKKEALLRELRIVESAIARKRAKVD